MRGRPASLRIYYSLGPGLVVEDVRRLEQSRSGQMTYFAEDQNGDGTPENEARIVNTYDDEGHTLMIEVDYWDDGSVDETATFTYDEYGNQVTTLIEFADGVVYATDEYECVPAVEEEEDK